MQNKKIIIIPKYFDMTIIHTLAAKHLHRGQIDAVAVVGFSLQEVVADLRALGDAEAQNHHILGPTVAMLREVQGKNT